MADLAAMQEEMEPLQTRLHIRVARPLGRGRKCESANEDLDPQIVWNGAKITLTKDQIEQLAENWLNRDWRCAIGMARQGSNRDWSDLVPSPRPPLYIQEKVSPQGHHRRSGAPDRGGPRGRH